MKTISEEDAGKMTAGELIKLVEEHEAVLIEQESGRLLKLDSHPSREALIESLGPTSHPSREAIVRSLTPDSHPSRE